MAWNQVTVDLRVDRAEAAAARRPPSGRRAGRWPARSRGTRLRRLVDEAVHRERQEVAEHDLDHRAQPAHGAAEGGAGERELGDRRVEHARRRRSARAGPGVALKTPPAAATSSPKKTTFGSRASSSSSASRMAGRNSTPSLIAPANSVARCDGGSGNGAALRGSIAASSRRATLRSPPATSASATPELEQPRRARGQRVARAPSLDLAPSGGSCPGRTSSARSGGRSGTRAARARRRRGRARRPRRRLVRPPTGRCRRRSRRDAEAPRARRSPPAVTASIGVNSP